MVNVCSFSIGMFLWVDQTTSKNLHKLYQIRKHSSRMSVPFGGDPQVNKFKQVPCVMSRGLELGRPLEDPLEKGVLCLRVPCSGGWALYNEVQCIMGNGHCEKTDRQTRLKHYLSVTLLADGKHVRDGPFNSTGNLLQWDPCFRKDDVCISVNVS